MQVLAYLELQYKPTVQCRKNIPEVYVYGQVMNLRDFQVVI